VAEPGTVVRADKGGLHLACGTGVVAIEELQLEGKKRMAAKAMLGGVDWKVGTRAGGAG
jgi:methionyl-tRNA formyltransferase